MLMSMGLVCAGAYWGPSWLILIGSVGTFAGFLGAVELEKKSN